MVTEYVIKSRQKVPQCSSRHVGKELSLLVLTRSFRALLDVALSSLLLIIHTQLLSSLFSEYPRTLGCMPRAGHALFPLPELLCPLVLSPQLCSFLLIQYFPSQQGLWPTIHKTRIPHCPTLTFPHLHGVRFLSPHVSHSKHTFSGWPQLTIQPSMILSSCSSCPDLLSSGDPHLVYVSLGTESKILCQY